MLGWLRRRLVAGYVARRLQEDGMQSLIVWLSGKKSYLLAGCYAVIALVEFLTKGDFSVEAILALSKNEALAALGAALRAGIAKRG